jgi:hypothetical protein
MRGRIVTCLCCSTVLEEHREHSVRPGSYSYGNDLTALKSQTDPVLATEDIRSKNRWLEGEHLVFRLKMPWPLQGEKLRGERFRFLAHGLEA